MAENLPTIAWWYSKSAEATTADSYQHECRGDMFGEHRRRCEREQHGNCGWASLVRGAER